MEFPKFVIVYNDNTTFTGESLTGDWNKIDKPIKSLFFSFGGVSLYLENFKQYNHLVERIQLVGKAGKAISKYLIMARQETMSEVVEFDLRRKTSLRRTVSKGEEYGNQILTGWKEGSVVGDPKFKHGKF